MRLIGKYRSWSIGFNASCQNFPNRGLSQKRTQNWKISDIFYKPFYSCFSQSLTCLRVNIGQQEHSTATGIFTNRAAIRSDRYAAFVTWLGSAYVWQSAHLSLLVSAWKIGAKTTSRKWKSIAVNHYEAFNVPRTGTYLLWKSIVYIANESFMCQ